MDMGLDAGVMAVAMEAGQGDFVRGKDVGR
jgi:hypothetical protein